MATLTLRNIPDELIERLRNRAKQNERSLNDEAIFLLAQSLKVEEMLASRQAAIERIAATRRDLPPLPADAPDSVDLLREDRER